MNGAAGALASALSADEAPEAASLLAACFAEDPLSRWLFPDPRRRGRLLRSLFLGIVRDCARFGVVDSVREQGRLCAVAASLPPGAFPPSPARNARMLPLLALTLMLYPSASRRIRRVLVEDAAAHVDEPHWYLQAIGVEGSRRGAGLGTALLEALLERADRDGAVTFLVTSNPPNLDWYRRHGFAELGEIRALPAAAPFWPMTRPAGAREPPPRP